MCALSKYFIRNSAKILLIFLDILHYEYSAWSQIFYQKYIRLYLDKIIYKRRLIRYRAAYEQDVKSTDTP